VGSTCKSKDGESRAAACCVTLLLSYS
jgi:hypothetical protein